MNAIVSVRACAYEGGDDGSSSDGDMWLVDETSSKNTEFWFGAPNAADEDGEPQRRVWRRIDLPPAPQGALKFMMNKQGVVDPCDDEEEVYGNGTGTAYFEVVQIVKDDGDDSVDADAGDGGDGGGGGGGGDGTGGSGGGAGGFDGDGDGEDVGQTRENDADAGDADSSDDEDEEFEIVLPYEGDVESKSSDSSSSVGAGSHGSGSGGGGGAGGAGAGAGAGAGVRMGHKNEGTRAMLAKQKPPARPKRRTISKNKPCPCGSKLKYKACCHPGVKLRKQRRMERLKLKMGDDAETDNKGDDDRPTNENGQQPIRAAGDVLIQAVAI